MSHRDDDHSEGIRVPWPMAAATAMGSMPGTDVRESVSLVSGELAHDDGVPHLVELPARGPGADMVGRAMSMICGAWSDLAVATSPSGWRLTAARGRDLRRAEAYLREDSDVLEEVLQGWDGPLILPFAGPWTLAAAVELPSGELLLRDRGAVRDLMEATAEATVTYALDMRRRLPRSQPIISLDEPSLPAVLAGQISTSSGRDRHRVVEPSKARDGLSTVVEALARHDVPVQMHCCASDAPLTLLRESGARSLAFDLSLHRQSSDNSVGECVDAGVHLVLGIADAVRPVSVGQGSAERGREIAVAAVQDLGHRLGIEGEEWASRIAVSPHCGMAGTTPDAARETLVMLRDIGRALREEDPVERDGRYD